MKVYDVVIRLKKEYANNKTVSIVAQDVTAVCLNIQNVVPELKEEGWVESITEIKQQVYIL